jgi:hypothetical protein
MHANDSLALATATLKASVDEPLCARSLAALLAASPSTTTAGAGVTVSDIASDDDTFGSFSALPSKKALGTAPGKHVARGSRTVHDESSTDTGDAPVLYESSTDESEYESDHITPSIQEETSTESGNETSSFRVANSVDASSDSEIEEERQRQTASTLPFIYPLTILLQYRAAAMLQHKKSSPSARYGTLSIDELPSAPSHKQIQKSAPVISSTHPRPCLPPSATIDEKLVKSVRSLMNELTVEKAEGIYEKVVGRGIKTPAHLAVVAFEVFQKATTHHQLIPTCVEFCLQFKADHRLQPAIGAEGGPQSFRQVLLDQCWPTFEHLIGSDQVDPSIRQSMDAAQKKQANGSVKLIGELVMRGILSPRLLIECAEALLRRQKACIDLLEPLAALLVVIGPKFSTQSGWVHGWRLEKVFQSVRELSRDEAIPLHFRLVLRDVVDLRASGWSRCGAAPTDLRKSLSDEVQPEAEGGLIHKPMQEHDHRGPPQSAINPKVQPKPPHSMLNLARAALLAPVESGARQPPKTQCTSVNPAMSLKKALRAEAKPLAGTPADTPASAVGQLRPQATKASPALQTAFDPKAFHRELSAILRELSATADVSVAVNRIRRQNVPIAHQEKEYVDLLTRAVESRAPARRAAFALVAALAGDEPTVFDRTKCLAGLSDFFVEVYEDLCEEVPQLPTVVRDELLPAMLSVFPQHTLDGVLPSDL